MKKTLEKATKIYGTSTNETFQIPNSIRGLSNEFFPNPTLLTYLSVVYVMNRKVLYLPM